MKIINNENTDVIELEDPLNLIYYFYACDYFGINIDDNIIDSLSDIEYNLNDLILILGSVSYLNMDIDKFRILGIKLAHNFNRRCPEFNYFDKEFLALLKNIIIDDIFNKNVNLFLTEVDLILGKEPLWSNLSVENKKLYNENQIKITKANYFVLSNNLTADGEIDENRENTYFYVKESNDYGVFVLFNTDYELYEGSLSNLKNENITSNSSIVCKNNDYIYSSLKLSSYSENAKELTYPTTIKTLNIKNFIIN